MFCQLVHIVFNPSCHLQAAAHLITPEIIVYVRFTQQLEMDW